MVEEMLRVGTNSRFSEAKRPARPGRFAWGRFGIRDSTMQSVVFSDIPAESSAIVYVRASRQVLVVD